VDGQFERPGRQIIAQPNAKAADDLDQWIACAVQLSEHPLDQCVDGRRGIGSEVATGLPTAFGDGGGADGGRVVADLRVVVVRARHVLL